MSTPTTASAPNWAAWFSISASASLTPEASSFSYDLARPPKMLRMPAPTSLNAFTPSTPWAVTTPRYSATGRPSIPGVVVTSISVPPCLRRRASGFPGLRCPPPADRPATGRRRSADSASLIDRSTRARPIPPPCMPLCSAQLVLALDLALDVLFGDLRPPEDIPRVHHHTDARSDDEEHRPEEPVPAGDRPDHHHERVDQHVDQKVTEKVAPLLQVRDRFVANGLLTCAGSHDGPPPLNKSPATHPGLARDQGPAQSGLTSRRDL